MSIYRYLNGYPSLLKELVRLISEIFDWYLQNGKDSFGLICHNVDRESSVYHERISGIRRYLFSKFSNKILGLILYWFQQNDISITAG